MDSRRFTLEAVKDYYDSISKKIETYDDAVLLSVIGSILFSISSTKIVDDYISENEDDCRKVLSSALDKIRIFEDGLDYEDLEVHRKVISLLETFFMDFNVLQNKIKKEELN